MKLKKEILYIPIFVLAIYLVEILFNFKDRNLHYIVEFLCLFLTGILIGIDKEIVTDRIAKIRFDKLRFLLTFVPLFIILFFLTGINLLVFIGIQNVMLPNFIIKLQGIIMYKQVGMVLLGYFITSNIKYIKGNSDNPHL